jgi:CubicO group peptidase (beta-lactamase class C family)
MQGDNMHDHDAAMVADGDNPMGFPVAEAADVGLDPVAVAGLVERARRDVGQGPLPSCQIALARNGKLVLSATLGDAPAGSRYIAFSCTKALTAASVWHLLGSGDITVDQPAAEIVPEFGANGKQGVTIANLLTHTGGFPHAPMGPPDWFTSEGRRQRFARWSLRWEPGSRYEYHSTAAHWVLAEIVEAVTGTDHREFFAQRVGSPLGLGITLGAAEDTQDNVRRLVPIGQAPTAEQLAELGVTGTWDPGEVVNDNLVVLNEPANLAVGVPGGGAVGNAADLAMFYQGLLANPDNLWDPDVLHMGTSQVWCDLDDQLTQVSALRTLGLAMAGDDGNGSLRGFGRTVSGAAFGHMGAGGQIGWADPATGVSFAYFTDGLDAFVPNQWQRLAGLSNRAGATPVEAA